jgi:hypothetical protein
MNVNTPIKNYLDSYCAMPQPPRFAVMIKGQWGSGKTWFIQRYMKQLEGTGKGCLYCSLYGVSSFDEIEDDLFAQMHPLLKEADVHLTGKIIQHVLKESINLNSGDTLPSFLQHSDRYVLFIDAFERCQLPLGELLGYLNDLVEHKGLKVIIALNDREVKGLDAYTPMIDKLVGKRFDIVANHEAALDHFIETIQTDAFRPALELQREGIIQTYLKSGKSDLRLLQQALLDAEYIYNQLPEDAQQSPELIKAMILEQVAYTFAFKQGGVTLEELTALARQKGQQFLEEYGTSKTKSRAEQFLEHHASLNLLSPVIGLNNLQRYVTTGSLDPDELAAAVGGSKFLIHNTQEDWVRLWHYFELTDEEFSKIFTQVQQNYMNRKYTSAYELLHIYGLFLEFSANNLYDVSAESIVEEAKEYITQIKNSGKLQWERNRDLSDDEGLAFHASDTDAFRQIRQMIEQITKAAMLEHMPQITHNLLILMRTDYQKFWNLVSEPDAEYFDQVIFPYIDPETFVKHFTKVHDMRAISAAFRQRYRPEYLTSSHRKELNWLKKIRELLVLESHRRQGKLSAYVIMRCIKESFDISINRLEDTVNFDVFDARR